MNIPAPFTENQKKYFDRSFCSWLNVAEGGKRGGKNVLNTLAFCTRLETHHAKIHLVAGVSTATARINVLECNGFGLLNFFEGRYREGKFHDRDCLYVQTPTGEKVVLVSGGGKNGDEKLIKGNTYGLAYVTEANECTPAFIQEVFDRTLADYDRGIYHDLNPKGSGHWYYKTVEAIHKAKQAHNPNYGYNYGHFTIADNLSVPDAQLRTALSTYDRKSVWYQKDILGLRKSPEGLIYDMFNDTMIYSDKDKPIDLSWRSNRTIAIDYGTTNPCVFLEILDDGECIWVDNEYRWDSRTEHEQKTDKQYAEDYMTFVGNNDCGAIVDPSAASFITELKSCGVFVTPANNTVIDGIRRVANMMYAKRLKINKKCIGLIDELSTYSWNTKAAEQGEERPIKENDHAPDALRYYINLLPKWRFN